MKRRHNQAADSGSESLVYEQIPPEDVTSVLQWELTYCAAIWCGLMKIARKHEQL